jgi:hypothetical protein
MENERRMTEGNELESMAKEYRIVLRKDGLTGEEPSDQDIMWSGELKSVDALNLWETAGLVPTIAKDVYELQESGENDTWQVVAQFGNEEDLEESLKEIFDPSSALIGEDEA